MDHIGNIFRESIETIGNTINKERNQISKIADSILEIFYKDKKILICGNGGSASQSQHFAAELVGRFKMNRRALPALSLITDNSIISAIGNDFGFNKVFEKQIEALGLEGDILIGISTTGNSENIVKAIKKAKEKKMKVISLTGKKGGVIKKISDITIVVPSQNTARIQEAHLIIIHSLCEIIEKKMFEKNG